MSFGLHKCPCYWDLIRCIYGRRTCTPKVRIAFGTQFSFALMRFFFFFLLKWWLLSCVLLRKEKFLPEQGCVWLFCPRHWLWMVHNRCLINILGLNNTTFIFWVYGESQALGMPGDPPFKPQKQFFWVHIPITTTICMPK